ncbi:MAG: hypothetical protein ACJ79A_12340 [Gemmatimonadaceae bacterium]
MIARLARLGLLLAALATPSAAQQSSPATQHGALRADEPVRGWTILSNSEVDDFATIAAAPKYRINHLELSHEVVLDLNEVRDEKKRGLVNRLVGHPAEIDLYALARVVEDPNVTADRVSADFITAHDGAAARPFVARAFRNAFDIVTSNLYTLGTNVANHSRLDYDGYSSSYARHVSGKWIEPPVAHVRHGVNRGLHYWRDVVDRIAPPSAKEPKGAQWSEVPWVRDSGWIHPGERMDEATLRMVLTEKRWGVAKAKESLHAIEDGRGVLRPADYRELHALFERTLLTARLHEGVASAYYGFRIWTRGDSARTTEVRRAIRTGLAEIAEVSAAMRAYPTPPPVGQWEWAKDADQAMKYHDWISKGWPKYGGQAFH